MRSFLTENQKTKLAHVSNETHTRTFTIRKVLGSGSSCIAYRAIDATSRLPVVIKECFPRNAAVRNSDGELAWNSSEDELHAKKCFYAAFETQREIQSTDETMNSLTHLVDSPYSGNNTLYTVSDMQNAKTYNDTTDSSMQEICITAKAIAQAIEKYHTLGYLHLDIKPQNILVLPETRELVKLLDFDSTIKKADAANHKVTVSYTHEYAAPELLQGKRDKLCEATDVYSIGAVVFSRIFDRTPSATDRGTFSDWDLDSVTLFKRLSNKAKRLTRELLRKTLSASIKGRYQNAAELIAVLDELIEESHPKRRYLVSTYAPSRNYFTGRSKELNEIHAAFTSGKRAVFVHGMGGIGKTELALHYVEQYKAHYDTVLLGRYSDSLDSLFKSPDFISIENDTEGKTGIDSIRGLVDDRTLLIVDNFDTEADPMLDRVLSLKCNLLFTSRHSFEETFCNDSAIAHLNISELAIDEQTDLFEHECGKELSTDEHNALHGILSKIGGYTLLIPLFAKQYKKDDFALDEIMQRIQDAGIKWASSIRLRHYKDTILSDSLYGILCEVLNMSAFSEDEICVMRSLSLLGGMVIGRKEFNSLFSGKYKNEINDLADENWIQLHGTGPLAKLSLHKIIAELAQNELKPNLHSCPEIKNVIQNLSNVMSETPRYIYDESGYAETKISPSRKQQYDNSYAIMVAVFKNCDLSDQDMSDYWANIVFSFVDSAYGDMAIFRDFLVSYVSQASNSNVCSYETLFKVYVVLFRDRFIENNHNALSLLKKALDMMYSSEADEEDGVEDEEYCFGEQDGEWMSELHDDHCEVILRNICLPVHRQICTLDSNGIEYWDYIPNFEELCKFLISIWPNPEDTFDEYIYEDFLNKSSPKYFKKRLRDLKVKDIEVDEDETVSRFDAQQILLARSEEDDDYNYSDEINDFVGDVFEDLSMEQRRNFTNNYYPSPNDKITAEDDEEFEVMNEEWAADMIVEEIKNVLGFSPMDPKIQPLKITASWRETTRWFNKSNIIDIEEEFYHQTGGPDIEAMLSCAYLLVKEYERCKEHLVELLICYQGMLSKAGYGVGSHFIESLPGYKNLLNVYSDIIPADLALWFVSEIIRISEEIKKSNNVSNKSLFDVYSMAERLATKANDSEKEAYYISKIASLNL